MDTNSDLYKDYVPAPEKVSAPDKCPHCGAGVIKSGSDSTWFTAWFQCGNIALKEGRERRTIECRDAELTALRSRIAEFGAVAINVVPGEHGQGEEVPSTPESLRSALDYLQEEWDTAERECGKLRSRISALEGALGALLPFLPTKGDCLDSASLNEPGMDPYHMAVLKARAALTPGE